MKLAHSEGPWWAEWGGKPCIRIRNATRAWAWIPWEGEEDKGNAAIMASGLAMLVALERVEGVLHTLLDDPELELGFLEDWGVLEQVQEALALARGGIFRERMETE